MFLRTWTRGWRDKAVVVEDDIGGVTSLVTGLSRRLHRHRAGHAAPHQHARPIRDQTTAHRLCRPPEYLPKGTSFTDVTDTQVQAIQDRLNRRPRIVLNGQTPTEKLNDIINGANTT